MFRVHLDSIEPKVLYVVLHCYGAIDIFIKIFYVIITFSYICFDDFKGVIWCDFKFSFLFGVLQADCA